MASIVPTTYVSLRPATIPIVESHGKRFQITKLTLNGKKVDLHTIDPGVLQDVVNELKDKIPAETTCKVVFCFEKHNDQFAVQAIRYSMPDHSVKTLAQRHVLNQLHRIQRPISS